MILSWDSKKRSISDLITPMPGSTVILHKFGFTLFERENELLWHEFKDRPAVLTTYNASDNYLFCFGKQIIFYLTCHRKCIWQHFKHTFHERKRFLITEVLMFSNWDRRVIELARRLYFHCTRHQKTDT